MGLSPLTVFLWRERGGRRTAEVIHAYKSEQRDKKGYTRPVEYPARVVFIHLVNRKQDKCVESWEEE
jgi:hypothetical protein